MHELESAILNLFRTHPNREFSTNNLVQEVFSQTPAEPDKESRVKAKRQKAQNHRKLLYHLNKLVADGVLKITKVQAKGEKCFSLALDEGELIIGKRNQKIIISKPAGQTTPLEGYIDQQIVRRLGRDQWATRINSLLLRAEKFTSLEELQNTIIECLTNVNDVIGVLGVERLLEHTTKRDCVDFIKIIHTETANFHTRVSLIFELSNIKQEMPLLQFTEAYCFFKPGNIDTIFNVDKQSLQAQSKLFEQIVEAYSQKTIKVYVKNNTLVKSPFLVGETGVYKFMEEDWNAIGEQKGVVCSQAALVIDNKRFLQHYRTPAEFRKLISTVLKSLVIVNTQQRRKTNDYFRHIIKLEKEKPSKLFEFSRNYVRFWNYDVEHDREQTVDLIKSCKELTEDFSNTQETIFKSVGMPSRFKVAFSSAFKKSDSQLTDRIYQKTTITKVEDFFSESMKNRLAIREDLFNLFEGADRVRFFRGGDLKPKDMVREISTIITSFTFPFFCYDFASLAGTVKLTQFMDG